MIKQGLVILLRLLNLLRNSGSKSQTTQTKLVPTGQEGIDISLLDALLRKRFPLLPDIFLSDRSFMLCKKSDIEAFLEEDRTDKVQYITEKHDCDDFAYRLMGQMSVPPWSDLTFGMIWTEYHALNIFVDEDHKVWLVEPQNDDIMEELEPWMGNATRFIIM